MFRLFRFLKGRDLFLTFVSIFLILIQTIGDVAQPFLVALMLKPEDSQDPTKGLWIHSQNNPIGGVWGLIGIMISCIIVSLISQGFGIVTSARVGVRLGGKVRMNAFKKIQSLTFREIDAFTTPSLITRLTNDIMFFQNAVIISIRMLVRSFFLIIGGGIGTIVVGSELGIPWIGGIFFGFMILAIGIIFVLLKKSVPNFRKQQKYLDDVNSAMRENLLGVRVVKAFNMQEEQKERFDVPNKKLTISSIVANRWATSIMPVIFFVVQISVVVIMMSMASTMNSSFQLTVVLQIIQLTNLVVIGFLLVVNVLIISAYTKASADRINEIFDANPSIPRNTSNNYIVNSNVEFKNVSFKYHESEESENALTNISFSAKPGEMIGIIGPTGGGKTTLVNLLMRNFDVTEGEIFVSNHNVKNINYSSLRESIGVSPQKSLILSGTIESNLKFGKEDATYEEMVEASELAQAIEFINKKDGKFQSEVEQRGNNLSGGQKQRISIARALIKKPKILILDDSTSALDMITEAKVQDAIRKYKDTTIFLIGQRVSAISKADKIIVLDKGEMVGFGDHNHLIKNCKLYKDISVSQGFGK